MVEIMVQYHPEFLAGQQFFGSLAHSFTVVQNNLVADNS
jgi:hypothetical protein